jgi:hypothetical protein
MAKFIARKIDRFINYLVLFLMVGSSMLLHTLTALTLKSYYGDIWGYVAFFLPGFSEAFLVIVQLGDNMFNFITLLALFIVVLAVSLLIVAIRKMIKNRYPEILEERI